MAGKGTRFALRIPLTLAITPALIVEASGHRFALPQHSVVEAVGLEDLVLAYMGQGRAERGPRVNEEPA